MLVLLWQEIFQSTGRAETSTPEEQCSGWWRGQGEQLLLNFSEVLHLSCMIWNVWNILPVLIWRDQWAYLRLNFEACTRLCWEICLLYLCLEKLLFRLLNESIFFGQAEKKNLYFSYASSSTIHWSVGWSDGLREAIKIVFRKKLGFWPNQRTPPTPPRKLGRQKKKKKFNVYFAF